MVEIPEMPPQFRDHGQTGLEAFFQSAPPTVGTAGVQKEATLGNIPDVRLGWASAVDTEDCEDAETDA